MKISHSARPRNRSRRSSRSPLTGTEMAGAAATGAVAGSPAITSVAPASGDPAIRSAIDVIWHRLEQVGQRPAGHERSYRPPSRKQVTSRSLHGRALSRNYVETTIGARMAGRRTMPAHRLVPPEFSRKISLHVPRRYPPARSHRLTHL